MSTVQHYQVRLNAHTICFELRRSNRQSLGFRIDHNGLRLMAPNTMALTDIKQALTQKSSWILHHLANQQARAKKHNHSQQQWENYGNLPFMGAIIQAIAQPAMTTPHFTGQSFNPVKGDKLLLPCSKEATIQTRTQWVEIWLKQQAQLWFEGRLQHFLQASGDQLLGWRLSNAKTRWGSCSSKKRININWRLIHFEHVVIDYVIAHEVAHLKVMHHGPEFWDHLYHLMPNFAVGQEVLKQHQPGEMPALIPLSR